MSPHTIVLYALVFTLTILGIALTARVERQREQLAELRAWVAEWLGPGRACRECGCTDAEACLSGCWWAEEDLCSSCADDHTSSLESERA